MHHEVLQITPTQDDVSLPRLRQGTLPSCQATQNPQSCPIGMSDQDLCMCLVVPMLPISCCPTDLESVKWIAPDKANPLPLADMATVRTAMRVAEVPTATLLQPSCPASLSNSAFLKAASRSSLPVGSVTACRGRTACHLCCLW